MALPEFLTPDEAAQYLTVAKQTMARWRCDGTGPAYVRMGRYIRYRAVDLDGWVDSRRHWSTNHKVEEQT